MKKISEHDLIDAVVNVLRGKVSWVKKRVLKKAIKRDYIGRAEVTKRPNKQSPKYRYFTRPEGRQALASRNFEDGIALRNFIVNG